MEKPQPPDSSLWEQLDAARRDAVAPPRPLDSFTQKEYRDKYNLPRTTAQDQLERLRVAGKVKCTRVGRRLYFTIVNGGG